MSFFNIFGQSKIPEIVYVESKYNFIQFSEKTNDTLILNLQWKFKSDSLYEKDSLFLNQSLKKIKGRAKSIQIYYWDYEENIFSKRLFGLRSEYLLNIVLTNFSNEKVEMTTFYEIVDSEFVNKSDIYLNPKRTLMIVFEQ